MTPRPAARHHATRWPPRRIVLESGLADAARGGRGAGDVRAPAASHRAGRRVRRRAWYNDSKATTPHAALTAIRGFDDVVLLAGGRNKGLDLASLATEHERVKAVVALGEAAPIIRDAFAAWCPVVEAASMEAAVVDWPRASPVAGDTVLLSPACASFDWYPDGGYPARGDDFKRLVHELLRGRSTMSSSTTVIGDRRRQALDRAAALRRHPTRRMASRPHVTADRRVLRRSPSSSPCSSCSAW